MHFQTSIWRKKYYFSYVIDYILLSLLLDVLSETNETFQNCSQFKPSALVQFISRYMQNRFEILLSAVYLHYKPTLSAEKHFKTIHYIKSKFYAIKFQINWIALLREFATADDNPMTRIRATEKEKYQPSSARLPPLHHMQEMMFYIKINFKQNFYLMLIIALHGFHCAF